MSSNVGVLSFRAGQAPPPVAASWSSTLETYHAFETDFGVRVYVVLLHAKRFDGACIECMIILE